MKNLHIIKVKYLGATNTRGSRVKLTSDRLKETKTINYNYSLNSVTEMAKEYLQGQGQLIIGQGEGEKHDYIILDAIDGQFKSIK